MKKYLKKIKMVFLPLVILFTLANYLFSFLKAKAQGRDMPMVVCDPTWNPPLLPQEKTADLIANPFDYWIFWLLALVFYPVYFSRFLKKELKKPKISRKRLLASILKRQAIAAVILTIILNAFAALLFLSETLMWRNYDNALIITGYFIVSFFVIFLILSVISGLVMVKLTFKSKILLKEGMLFVIIPFILLSLIYFYYLKNIIS